MRNFLLTLPFGVLAALSTTSRALADEPEATEAPPAEPTPPVATPVPSDPIPVEAPRVAPLPSTGEHVQRAPMPFGKPIRQGVALGYENGLWGSFFMQAIRLKIPFGTRWGMAVKALLTHPTDHTGNVHPHFGGGRVDILGGSPLVMGFARMYGGGGITVATKVLGTGGNKDVHVGATGYFGFELFVSHAVSWMFEIGGGSNVDGSAAGATVTGGLQVYLGSGEGS